MPDQKAITTHDEFDPDDVDVVTVRAPRPLVIVDPDPAWPTEFARLRDRLLAVLGSRALAVEHVGSTSVPGLAAKAIIDVDLVVADSADEDAYAADLVRAGFPLLLRERRWHEHRMFGSDDPYGNVHVFGPDSPELVRHVVFRNWLRDHPADRDLYLRAKQGAAATSDRATTPTTSTVDDPVGRAYNLRKQSVIREILDRALGAAP